jgi:septal ring factor EnvC (AmiA/AmiB activator)
VTLDVDLEREQDIEELRRIAQALQAQNQLLLEALAKKSREIKRLRGKPGDLQLTLKMLETLQAKAKAAEEAVQRAEAEQKKRAAERERQRAEQPRKPGGPTPQPMLPVIALDPAPGAAPITTGVIEKRGRA